MADDVTGMFEVLDALESALKSAEPEKLEHLAKTLDACCEDSSVPWWLDYLWEMTKHIEAEKDTPPPREEKSVPVRVRVIKRERETVPVRVRVIKPGDKNPRG